VLRHPDAQWRRVSGSTPSGHRGRECAHGVAAAVFARPCRPRAAAAAAHAQPPQPIYASLCHQFCFAFFTPSRTLSAALLACLRAAHLPVRCQLFAPAFVQVDIMEQPVLRPCGILLPGWTRRVPIDVKMLRTQRAVASTTIISAFARSEARLWCARPSSWPTFHTLRCAVLRLPCYEVACFAGSVRGPAVSTPLTAPSLSSASSLITRRQVEDLPAGYAAVDPPTVAAMLSNGSGPLAAVTCRATGSDGCAAAWEHL